MEQHTAHNGADVITQLLKAHVSDEAEHIDVHEAIAVRDDLRELAERSPKSCEFSFGDVVKDTRGPHWGSGMVRITEVLDTVANKYHVPEKDNMALSYLNPEEPDDAQVVKGVYTDGSDKEYAFPVTRLE